MKFLLVVQLIVTLVMIAVILLQKSEGGGLGMGGGNSGGGMFTARGAANFLTRVTSILAAIFMGLCLLMTWMNRNSAHQATNFIFQEQAAK